MGSILTGLIVAMAAFLVLRGIVSIVRALVPTHVPRSLAVASWLGTYVLFIGGLALTAVFATSSYLLGDPRITIDSYEGPLATDVLSREELIQWMNGRAFYGLFLGALIAVTVIAFVYLIKRQVPLFRRPSTDGLAASPSAA